MTFNLFPLARGIQQQGLRFLSTRPAEREVVTFMRLNNLADNPGAIKKVIDNWLVLLPLHFWFRKVYVISRQMSHMCVT